MRRLYPISFGACAFRCFDLFRCLLSTLLQYPMCILSLGTLSLFSVRRVAVYEVCGCKADWLSSTFRTTSGMQSPSSDYRSGRFSEADSNCESRLAVFRLLLSLAEGFLCVTHLSRVAHSV